MHAIEPVAVMLPTLNLAELEQLAIARALAETHGNRVRAARLLGIHVRTLHRKLRAAEAGAGDPGAGSAPEGARSFGIVAA